MPKESLSYTEKKKVINAITERRLTEDFSDLLKEHEISSSTFYIWREEVKDAMTKNRKNNSYKKSKKISPENEGLSFDFNDISMTIDSATVVFERADVRIVGNSVYFDGKGVIRKDQ